MTDVLWFLLVAFVLATVLNGVPVFMPPTWAMLTFFYVREDIPLIPLAIAGSLGAATGRALLALGSRTFGPKIVPARFLGNIEVLVATITARRRWGALSLALFAVGFVPTNQLFIALGLASAPMLAPLVAFFLSRGVMYAVEIAVAGTAVSSLGELIDPRRTGWVGIVLQIASFGLLIAVLRIDWSRRLRRYLPESVVERLRESALTP